MVNIIKITTVHRERERDAMKELKKKTHTKTRFFKKIIS